MNCQLMVGASWNETTDPITIIGWETRVCCTNTAQYIYSYKERSFQGAQTHLCQEHHHDFKRFLGILQPYIEEE
jgi:hypothetical protein